MKETLDRWKAIADAHPDSEDYREPPARLRSLAQPYLRALEKIRRAPDSLAEIQRDFLASILPVFGYDLTPSWRPLGHGSATVRIPLIGEVTTQSGASALWIIEALPTGTSDDELGTDPLSLSPHPSQYATDPQNTTQGVFDPELLKQVFLELAGEIPTSWGDARLAHLADKLKLVDGTLLPALPRMHWALWLNDQNRA